MPLLDHFHPPLSERRKWDSLLAMWGAGISARLNATLDDAFHAEPLIRFDGGVHVASNGSLDRTTALVIPTTFPDDLEVRILATNNGMELVAAIELVSPSNKDRPETREAFVAKCRTYLSRGIGLVIVDIVTDRLANLHDELMAELGQGGPFLLTTPTYAAAYRPSRRPTGDQIEVWPTALALGQPLPTVPLALRNAETLPLDLERTYDEACARSKIR